MRLAWGCGSSLFSGLVARGRRNLNGASLGYPLFLRHCLCLHFCFPGHGVYGERDSREGYLQRQGWASARYRKGCNLPKRIANDRQFNLLSLFSGRSNLVFGKIQDIRSTGANQHQRPQLINQLSVDLTHIDARRMQA